jgi:NDP-4-keto-2,6-dideoxyhexose 3-C-methyltransferase
MTTLDLGVLYLSGFPLPDGLLPDRAPLDLCQCETCQLVQLRHTVAPDALYSQYWYKSGVNETMVSELQSVAADAILYADDLIPGEIVIDIGANDGTLLDAYELNGRHPWRIAIEPAANLQDALADHCDQLIQGYFPADAEVLLEEYSGHVRVITQIACFYGLDDPRAAVEAVAQLLAPNGVWIVQFQDLAQMLKATAFDNICHEHLVYYSLGSFERLIAPYGLRVVHAEERAINGGSYRLIVQHTEVEAGDSTVTGLRRAEAGCDHWLTLERFAWRVGEARKQIQAALMASRNRGRTIDAYGASTKFNTLAQYCGLGPETIRQAWERSPEKWHRQTVTGIPIVREETGRADPPDLLLATIWQFREAILRREAAYLGQGGTILFPLPEVDLVVGGGR